MNSVLILVFLAVLIRLSSSTRIESVSDRRGRRYEPEDSVVFDENSKYLDGPCKTKANLRGTCRKISNCPKLWDEMGRGNIINCFFEKKEPVACCPLDVGSGTSPRKFLGCGKRDGWNRGRVESSAMPVVDGIEAVPHSWPWMAAIFMKAGNGQSRFVCGGSLISKTYILTAAHCFSSSKTTFEDTTLYFVVLGAHDLSPLGVGSTRINRKRRPIVEGVRYSVVNILKHPRYDPKIYYNDISLIRLASQVGYTSEIMPVCLPSVPLPTGQLLVNKTAYVTGWGDTSYGGEPNSHLREVSLPITSHNFCMKMYSKLAKRAFPQGITRGQICAGGTPAGGKDACQGDSGGPLVLDWGDGTYVQVGIVSFGYHCAEPNFPGVYTNVSNYLPWINSIVS